MYNATHMINLRPAINFTLIFPVIERVCSYRINFDIGRLYFCRSSYTQLNIYFPVVVPCIGNSCNNSSKLMKFLSQRINTANWATPPMSVLSSPAVLKTSKLDNFALIWSLKLLAKLVTPATVFRDYEIIWIAFTFRTNDFCNFRHSLMKSHSVKVSSVWLLTPTRQLACIAGSLSCDTLIPTWALLISLVSLILRNYHILIYVVHIDVKSYNFGALIELLHIKQIILSFTSLQNNSNSHFSWKFRCLSIIFRLNLLPLDFDKDIVNMKGWNKWVIVNTNNKTFQ